MGDFYLQNPDALKGQPKKVIGDYVDSMGVPVPRRFSSLEEAMNSDVNFIMRSENRVEYASVSGLLTSFRISNEIIGKSKQYVEQHREEDYEEGDMRRGWCKEAKAISRIGSAPQKEVERMLVASNKDLEFYFELTGTDARAFIEETSFSCWELLGGFNRAIAADSAIRGRYHIFTVLDMEKYDKGNYTIFDNGLTTSLSEPLPESLKNRLDETVNFYEKVRNFGNFEPRHCPIVEFQTVDGTDYFLQYHRTRDFSPPTFELRRAPKAGEVEVELVRGATPEEGWIVNTPVHHGDSVKAKEAFFQLSDFGINYLVSEVMSRERKVQFINYALYDFAYQLAIRHESKSLLLNPEVTVVLRREKIVSDNELDHLMEETRKTKSLQSIPISIVSDGRRAYVRRA